MKYTQTVAAPAEFIFDKLMESGLDDVKKQTGRVPDHINLDGYRYSKKFSNGHTGSLTFDEVKRPSVYAFSSEVLTSRTSTRYELEDLGDKQTKATIIEKSSSGSMANIATYWILQLILGHKKKKQMALIFKHFEDEYAKQA